MELKERSPTPMRRPVGLGRLTLLLLGSILGIAGFFHLMYGVSLLAAIAVVAEIGVMLVPGLRLRMEVVR